MCVMKVAFDQQVFLLQKHGGISRYICNLATELSLLGVDTTISAPLHFNRALYDLQKLKGIRRYIGSPPVKSVRLLSAASTALSRISLTLMSPDIVHETYFSMSDFRPRGAKRVVTVYDMIHERFPDKFERAHLTSEAKFAAVNRADHIICISESTRRDLMELFTLPEYKVSVTYLAPDKIFRPLGDAKTSMTSRPFLLFVGARGGYKNFEKFLRAAARLDEIEDLDIVCFGGGAFTAAEYVVIKSAGLRLGQLIQKSGDDHTLLGLYRHALALVYPSLYEGFGIPPLEAMAADCPVVTSNSSSLYEVVGDAGEYFDPEDEDDMCASIQRVVSCPQRRAELVALGRTRQATFTWRKCALETADVYRSLL